jgi:quinol-cytochrome oxidoreductase complex cytochrome b subunit
MPLCADSDRSGIHRCLFDQDAYWGLGIGAPISSRVPVLAPSIVRLLLGGPISGATLSRFFALHVFVISGSLIAFVGLRLLLVLKHGISRWWYFRSSQAKARRAGSAVP